MSIVIVGGHDRMVAQYKKICKSYKCKCKVFTQMEADFSKKIGCPDLLVLFTNTVSHTSRSFNPCIIISIISSRSEA